MKSFALALILLVSTAAHAGTETLKGDAVIQALSGNLKNMTLVVKGQKDSMSPTMMAEMINTQLKNSASKTRAVCTQRKTDSTQDCKIMMVITPAAPADGGTKQKPGLVVYKFTISQDKVSSELVLDQQK